jgi:hypothetical protein
MNRFFRRLLLGALVTLTLYGANSSTVTAQRTVEYWPGYWHWYDNTYRPYYHRYYGPTNSSPAYSGPAYSGPTYYDTAPPAYYGGNAPYYTPYYTRPYYGNGVQVGPLRFGWW